MARLSHNIYFKTIAMLFAIVFFSCQDNYEDIKRMQRSSTEPAGVAEHMNLKHTDSGRVILHLISDKMKDFSNKEFAYTTFPEGLEVHIFDDKQQQTTISSDYAIIYSKTDLIDLRGNVKIVTHDGKTLLAEQLYYDQKAEWIFTNNEYKYEAEDGGYNIGKGGFDANQDMSVFSSLDNDGQQYIDD